MTDEEISAVVERMATRVARDWPGIDYDDIAQEMHLKILENRTSIDRAKTSDQEGIVAGLANIAGKSYASRERQFWQHGTAEWLYTPAEVRALLTEFFDLDAWNMPIKRPEGTNQTLLGDGLVIPLMDVREGFEGLPEHYQAVIIRAFAVGETLDTKSRKQLQRAVDKMAALLNRRMVEKASDNDGHNGPGSRRAISNAHAQAITND